MSLTSPITCLFCQHINPEEASFCNSCAAQLNLQPCLHCDAVDDRMATHCHKCGTPFPLLQMPEPDAAGAPGALNTAQTSPALVHANVPPAKEALLGADLTPAPTVYRSGWLMSGTAFLLVLLAVSAYLYLRQPAKNISTPNTKALVQMAPTVPAVPTAPVTPAASAAAPQVDVVVTPTDTPRTTTVGATVAGKVSKAVPPGAGSAPPIRSAPVTDSEAVTRRVPALGNECVPALATLGLCNPETGQEKP